MQVKNKLKYLPVKSNIVQTAILNSTNFYLGSSGLVLPVPNKQHYPPEFQDRSRLNYYGVLNNSIEVNSSFYKIPMLATVKRWAAEVPQNFKFTFKLFKGITHQKVLVFDEQLIAQFFEVVSAVGDKKACILVQFPPSVRIAQLKQLDLLFATLKKYNAGQGWKIAIEFRHQSLYSDEIVELLEYYQFGMVIHDKAALNVPFGLVETTFVYLRFHGPNGNYKGSYQDYILHEYASYIAEWINYGKEVFVYFNNTMGNVYANLNTLRQFVMEKS